MAAQGGRTTAERRKMFVKSVSVASATPVTDNSFECITAEKDYSGLMPRSVGTERPVPAVPIPETRFLTPEILFSDDTKPNITLLASHISREGKLEVSAAVELIHQCKAILASEPNVLELKAPLTIFGDLHGQFYDLYATLGDLKSLANTQLLFLGDYVDRGNFSIEIMFLLMALKIQYPNNVWLLRGNHETRMMAEYMTFALECEHKYSCDTLYQEFALLFDTLPLCATIVCDMGTYLAVHGGLSPSLITLNDIRALNRFREPETEGPLCDLLWSDPLDDPTPTTNMQAWLDTRYVENTPRQTSWFYGPRAIMTFLQQNDLIGIIRAHQVVEGGYKEHYAKPLQGPPPVITLFSCPNYCDMYHNKAAIMILNENSYKFYQFTETSHPFYFPDFADAFSYGLPFLMESMVSVLADLVIAIKEEPIESVSPTERDMDVALTDKLSKLRTTLKLQEIKRERLDRLRQSMLASDHDLSLFDRVRLGDQVNEQAPRRKTPTKSARRPLQRTSSLTVITDTSGI
ncbi:calcineurin catalytic subunit A [Pelomyxa schiedti]|nr:calcineurin catalytic subunit A [Pelomyxa schiedti]